MSVKPLQHPVFDKLEGYEFLLCSTSDRRLEILNQLGFNPKVVPSHFEENLDKAQFERVEDYVRETATGKILAVWDELSEAQKRGKTILLAADTVVANEGIIYEKPKAYDENCRVIKVLRDSKETVYVHSGVIILVADPSEPKGYRIDRSVETSTLEMDPTISDDFVERYCATGEGLQVAGGFRIQGYGINLITGTTGDFYNIVGLPAGSTFQKICRMLGCSV